MKDWISLFIETTGDNFDYDEIDFISAIKFIDGIEVANFYRKIETDYILEIENNVQESSAYKKDFYSSDQNYTFRQPYIDLKDFIGDLTLVSHYKFFEKQFLKDALNANGLDMIQNNWIDTQESLILQNNYGGSLQDVMDYLDMKLDNELNSNFLPNYAIKKIYNRILN